MRMYSKVKQIRYNPDFYCTNCNRQGHTSKYCTRRKTVNYLEENDSEGEIYLTTRSGKSYNVKNFNSFTKNKDKDDKEIKRKKKKTKKKNEKRIKKNKQIKKKLKKAIKKPTNKKMKNLQEKNRKFKRK